MTVGLHLRIVGALLLVLGVSHAWFNRYFGWKQELEAVSLLTRKMFFVHTFFIGLGVTLAGAGSLLYADSLLRPDPLSRALLAGMTLFWFCRLLAQFFAYDRALWRGDRFRTFMHTAFTTLWCYVTATYGIALATIWNAKPALN
ncbi:MAG TPA: hypothetical protein VGN16_25835 [Acidobacteriaceae bacterium]|jgi:hypothetical protein